MRQTPTVSEVLTRFLAAQHVESDEAPSPVPFFGGVFAIFGHGNVAGLGPALGRGTLPVYRAHNEQGMGLASVAYAKAHRRRRAMVCTTSIGPGATNLVTPAAAAHVSRLPVLLLLGEAFASRGPDPVLQQTEHRDDPSRTVNDCFRPVARYFDRITRPDQVLPSLEAAMRVLTDPVETGPVVLALPQDVQVAALSPPDGGMAPRTWRIRAPAPDPEEMRRARDAVAGARRPLLVVGGGAVYAGAERQVVELMDRGVPACSTHAGRDALPSDHPLMLGGVGVTGSGAANQAVQDADLLVVVGSRLTDFTTGSRDLFDRTPCLHVNVDPRDAHKHGAQTLVADARHGLAELVRAGSFAPDPTWTEAVRASAADWWQRLEEDPWTEPLTDGRVLDVVAQWARADTTVVASSGSIPGELQKRWRGPAGVGTHVEYGFSTMGYEIAGALGVKMAHPEREVVSLVGDGAYLMLNGELESAVSMGRKIIAVLFDNGGFGCIHRLQRTTDGPHFGNLRHRPVDFVAHASSLGAQAERVHGGRESLRAALDRARACDRAAVVVVETDPEGSTGAGGWPWLVPGAGS